MRPVSERGPTGRRRRAGASEAARTAAGLCARRSRRARTLERSTFTMGMRHAAPCRPKSKTQRTSSQLRTFSRWRRAASCGSRSQNEGASSIAKISRISSECVTMTIVSAAVKRIWRASPRTRRSTSSSLSPEPSTCHQGAVTSLASTSMRSIRLSPPARVGSKLALEAAAWLAAGERRAVATGAIAGASVGAFVGAGAAASASSTASVALWRARSDSTARSLHSAPVATPTVSRLVTAFFFSRASGLRRSGSCRCAKSGSSPISAVWMVRVSGEAHSSSARTRSPKTELSSAVWLWLSLASGSPCWMCAPAVSPVAPACSAASRPVRRCMTRCSSRASSQPRSSRGWSTANIILGSAVARLPCLSRDSA